MSISRDDSRSTRCVSVALIGAPVTLVPATEDGRRTGDFERDRAGRIEPEISARQLSHRSGQLAHAVGGDGFLIEARVRVFWPRRFLEDIREDVTDEIDRRAGEPGDIHAVVGHRASDFERCAEVVFEDGADESGSPCVMDLAHRREHVIHRRLIPVTGGTGTTASNPILKSSTAGEGGLYWIEVMPYDPNAGNSGLVTNGSANLPLNLKPSIAYRITAIAHGLKPNTQVVLQSTFVRQKVKN